MAGQCRTTQARSRLPSSSSGATLARTCSRKAYQLTSLVAFPAARQSGSLISIPSCPHALSRRAIGHRRGWVSAARCLASSRSFRHPQLEHSCLYRLIADSRRSTASATSCRTCVDSAWMRTTRGRSSGVPAESWGQAELSRWKAALQLPCCSF